MFIPQYIYNNKKKNHISPTIFLQRFPSRSKKDILCRIKKKFTFVPQYIYKTTDFKSIRKIFIEKFVQFTTTVEEIEKGGKGRESGIESRHTYQRRTCRILVGLEKVFSRFSIGSDNKDRSRATKRTHA